MIEKPILHSLSCAGEFNERNDEMSWSVWKTATGEVVIKEFFDGGTEDLAEFFAITSAMRFQYQEGMEVPTYSRCSYAIGCVLRGFSDAYLDPITEWNNSVEELSEVSANFLEDCPIQYEVLKWNTREWGNILSNFGTKYVSKESIEKTKKATSII
jgi:hypothetical protein